MTCVTASTSQTWLGGYHDRSLQRPPPARLLSGPRSRASGQGAIGRQGGQDRHWRAVDDDIGRFRCRDETELAIDERNAAGGVAGAKAVAMALDDKADAETGKA